MESKKILVVSDTHHRTIDVIATQEKDPHDMLFHLGDRVKDADQLESALHIPVYRVRGNNDYWEEETPLTATVPVFGIRFLLTHGHCENVHYGITGVLAKAKEKSCQVALFGHTHMRFDRTVGGIRLLNPGSPSLPRDGKYSVLSLQVFENGSLEAKFIDL